MNAQLKPIETEAKAEYNIPVLCAAWIESKQKEQQAKDARTAIEAFLIVALNFEKLEGSQTFKPEGFKVECKAGLNYKLDAGRWDEIAGNIPDGLRPVKTKLEVDERGAKFLKTNNPELWRVASQAITVTPAKVGVKVERVEG